MRLEQYEAIQSADRIGRALHEADQQASQDSARYDFSDVFQKKRQKLTDKVGRKNT
ncbi:hypothetical protein [Sporolactobacillus putidus]|uniref:Uncharacterized protein n=1 Tax=Sporolactobacillus putidus TaxID=492735 RepID=A0A917S551_9BACL|nr:hypothetical protein [Sporolactobacillus putidus]GGL56418.1 hypothetical protein GCM10007968_20540 [Sporolactobacillus putidus]